MKNDTIECIRERINEAQQVVLAGHTNPDGDAIGSTMAMAMALKNAGKEVTVLFEPYAPKYDLIPGKELLGDWESGKEAELFISLDCGDSGRLGASEAVFLSAKHTINIDHHESNPYFAQINFVDTTASSASEIVFDILNGFLPMDSKIASALYAGLIYDTGGFRHTSTSPKTMRTAAVLMEKDIPFHRIYQTFFDSRSFGEAKIMAIALENAELLFDGQVICSTITTEEIQRAGGSSKEMDAVINYIKNVVGVKIACFFYEKNETDVKGSFRGDDGYDVCALAKKFDGGGHIKASGCTITKPIQEAKALVLAEVEKML